MLEGSTNKNLHKQITPPGQSQQGQKARNEGGKKNKEKRKKKKKKKKKRTLKGIV